ncbi:MAG: hypothetical protein ABR576_05475 [Thermoanaerobaculia bacterium]
MAHVHGPMSSATPAVVTGISKAIRPVRKIGQVLLLAMLASAAAAPARAQLEMIGGTLEVFVADDFANDYAFQLYALRTDSGEQLELVGSFRRPASAPERASSSRASGAEPG